jgi:hypothetical protein
MSIEHLIFLSVPGLRPRDVDPVTTPTLYAWANQGAMAELSPSFPCVTSPVQASMLTGSPPGTHGVIANGFYHRDRGEVEFWVAPNSVIQGRQTWDILRERSGFTSAAWHAQNIKGASADWIVTPAPIHEPDGATKLWCYSKPEGTYQQLLDSMGHFPLQHYWGPMSNVQSTRWILHAALWLLRRHAPNFHWIYLPHLDYASQKFGPNGQEAKRSLTELDQELSAFARQVGESELAGRVVYLVAGEYAITDVTGVVYPNRVLRQEGLLAVHEESGAETLDVRRSAAFAMVDHQFAHVYLNDTDRGAAERVAKVFADAKGVATVLVGRDRERLGMNHPRSGDVVLICDDAHWMAYYWWLDDAAAPRFARTVDIHRKPGYDPIELFFDPATRGIPLNAGLARGSHGVPVSGQNQKTAIICSAPSGVVEADRSYHDVDVQGLVLRAMGAA